MMSFGTNLREVSRDTPKVSILHMSLKITNFILQLHLLRGNELNDYIDILIYLYIIISLTIYGIYGRFNPDGYNGTQEHSSRHLRKRNHFISTICSVWPSNDHNQSYHVEYWPNTTTYYRQHLQTHSRPCKFYLSWFHWDSFHVIKWY